MCSSWQQVTSRSQTRTLSSRSLNFSPVRKLSAIIGHSVATMASPSPDDSTSKSLRPTRQVYTLIYVLLLCLYQLRVSFSAEKRVISAEDTNDTPAGAGYHKNDTNNSMSACLLIMDDTIKLTEWIAYHYTVLPLSHLIVAIDPASVMTNEIQHVLSLWENHLEYIDVWTNDTWMKFNETEGWPPGAYRPKGVLNTIRLQRRPNLAHVSSVECVLLRQCP